MSPQLLGSRTRRFGVALLCIKVALVPLVFDAASEVSFTLPKALLSHALSYALAAVLIGLLLRFRGEFVVRSPIHVPVLAFFAASAIATLTAVDPLLASFGAHGRMLGLGTIADWTTLYFAFVLLVRTRGEALFVLGAALAPTAVVLAYEVIQILGRDPLRWTIDSGGRPFSTLGQPTTLGAYLVTIAAGVVAFALLVEDVPRWQRVALLWWAALLVLGAINSGTRSVLLGAVAAPLVLGVLWLRQASPRARVLGLAGGVLAAAALAVVVAVTPLGARLSATIVGGPSGSVETDPSTAGRLDLYRIAGGMLLERPLFGYGPDSFAAGVPKYRPELAAPNIRQSLASSAHGWIPYVATGSGVIGLAAFAAMLVVTVWALLRRTASPLALCGAAVAAAFLGTGLTTTDDIGVDWLLWLGLALVASNANAPQQVAVVPGSQGTRKRARGARRDTQRDPFAYAPAIFSAIAVLTLFIGVAALGAGRAAKLSEDLRLVGQTARAVEAARQSVSADANRAEYWHALGFAYISAQRYRDASTAFDHAIALAPYDVAHLQDQIQTQLLLASSGDAAARERARRYADQAVTIDPNNPRAHYVRANLMRTLGDLPEAERSVERALALDPGSQNEGLYVTAVQVFDARGRRNDAIAVGQLGLSVLPSTVVALRIELAKVLIAQGRLQEALLQVDTALSIQPNLTAAQQLRQQIRAALGQ